MNPRAAYPAVYALLRAAADAADHWLQTDHQARHKADDSAAGHRALAGHVASYVAAQGAALYLGNRLLDLGLRPRRIAAALAFSGATHYLIDRRWPIRGLAEITGKGAFYARADGGLNGAYCLDQAAHHSAEAIAAYLAVRN